MPRILYIIFILAIIVKLLCGIFLGSISKPEIFEYEHIANNMLSGKGFLYNFQGTEYRAFIQPLYPVFIASVYALTGHNRAVMVIIQSIISSALCFIIYPLGRMVMEKRQAILAAALVAFHPGLAVYSVVKIHTLVFDTFFYLLTIYLMLKFIQKPAWKIAISTGFVAGLAMLSRSTILIFLMFVLIYALFALRNLGIRHRLKYVALICIVAAATYSPWVMRNYMVFKSPVFTQTSSGENLWVGNNEWASGSAILASGESVYTKMPQEMLDDRKNLDELGHVRYYKNYFFNFVKEEPLLFLKLFAKKFYYFWWFAPHTGAWYSKGWLYAYKLYYVPIFFLFIAGVVFVFRDGTKRQAVLLLLVYMLSISLLHAIANVDTRHRWTVESVMLIFATAGFFKLWDILAQK